jgi:hypothetical protein
VRQADQTDAPRQPNAIRLSVLSVLTPPVIQVVEGALMAAGGPLTLDQILGLYADEQRPRARRSATPSPR